ncbi:MAG: hypothetical protein V7K48_16720 [Nostoc sp.]|uniref:hypothetical protein n=1 Tax=Nostoc sp. TaxID=1180 RepID=UPI002FF623DF
MTPLIKLINDASLLLDEIAEHPDYKLLVAKGYYPDLTLGDAQTALDYLCCEADPPVIAVPEIPEVEVRE